MTTKPTTAELIAEADAWMASEGAYRSDHSPFLVKKLRDHLAEIEEQRKQPVAWLPDDGAYIIKFDDADRRDEFFAMTGARDAAMRRYEQISVSWNAHLFVKIDSNSRDCGCPSAVPPPSPQPSAPDGWRCFHCDEFFTDEAAARLHFGHSEIREPICTIGAEAVRRMQAELDSYHEEDTALMRQIYGLGAEHHAAKQRAEEAGYAKGLADGRASVGGPVCGASCNCGQAVTQPSAPKVPDDLLLAFNAALSWLPGYSTDDTERMELESIREAAEKYSADIRSAALST